MAARSTGDDAPEPAPEGESADAAAVEEAPRPRRRKRRRPASPEATPDTQEPELSPAGETDERAPAFARGWPRDEALDRLVAAFEAGDYARVRREAPVLARKTGSDAVRRAARELARRLDPDPVAVYMLMAAVALLVFLAGWYWLHPHIQ
jgi:hypothetical protein